MNYSGIKKYVPPSIALNPRTQIILNLPRKYQFTKCQRISESRLKQEISVDSVNEFSAVYLYKSR